MICKLLRLYCHKIFLLTINDAKMLLLSNTSLLTRHIRDVDQEYQYILKASYSELCFFPSTYNLKVKDFLIFHLLCNRLISTIRISIEFQRCWSCWQTKSLTEFDINNRYSEFLRKLLNLFEIHTTGLYIFNYNLTNKCLDAYKPSRSMSNGKWVCISSAAIFIK